MKRRRRRLALLLTAALIAAVGSAAAISSAAKDGDPPMSEPTKLAKATFAGGCFWCMEPPFDKLDGVISTTSGYTGGNKKNPTYEEVSAGATGHAEAIEVVFDPAKISYRRLLEVFWRNIDPTTVNRQFCDVGDQYRTAIFYHGEEQERLAEESKKKLEESGKLSRPIVTEITAAGEFYPAEDYHQNYYEKNPLRYKFYRYSCGRDERLEQLWGDDD
jgi:peptide-methionine (S)-S-oxide reductase